MGRVVLKRIVGVGDLVLSALVALLAIPVAGGLPEALARSAREKEDLVFSLIALPIIVMVAGILLILGVVFVRRLRPGLETQRRLSVLALLGVALSLVPLGVGALGGEWFSPDYILYVVPGSMLLASYLLVRSTA
jgi:hypothetical protein